MSFARQITLVLFLTVLGVLAVRAILTVYEMRDYLATQLQSHATDAARSLGLSISLHLADGDELFAESIVDSMFDSGAYESITVFGADGQAQIERMRAPRSIDVPQWFTSWAPIEAPQSSAELTSGWTQAGSVSVRSHAGYAYEQLWRSALHSLQSVLVFLIVVLPLLSLLLRVMLKPLKQIEEQARAVARREFPRIDNLPSADEFRRVAEAMNFMTERVESFIDENTEHVRRLQREVYLDPVTGLRNRRALLLDIEHLVRESSREGPGAMVLIHVQGLDVINRNQGYDHGNAFMVELARALVASVSDESVALGRWGGAIFAMILPRTTLDELTEHAQKIIDDLQSVHYEGDRAGAVNLGVAVFTGVDDAKSLIEKCESALHNAESGNEAENASGQWHLWQSGETAQADEIREQEHWQQELKRVIAERDVVLESQPVLDMRSGHMLHHEVLARYRDENGDLISAGRFIPVAARLGLSTSLDMVIVEKALDVLTMRFQSTERLAVNLSSSAIQDADFVRWLSARLSSEPKSRRERLCLEVTEHVIAQHRDDFLNLANAMLPLGVTLGVDHCGEADVSLAGLRGLPLDYAKLYGGLVRGVEQDEERQNILRALVSIGHGMGFTMIAEFVENDAEHQAVRKLGFDGVQGYQLGRPVALE